MTDNVEVINVALAKKIMNNADLNREKLCTVLNKVYCQGRECENVYEIVASKQIGENSGYGKIYEACLYNNCDFVAKWQNNQIKSLDEAKYQMKAAEYKLAPEIKQIFECKEGVIIIMDALSRTLMKVLTTVSYEQTEDVLEYFKKEMNEYVKKYDILKYENLNFINNCETIRDLKSAINYINESLADIGAPLITEVPKIRIEDTERTKTLRKKIITQCFNLLVQLHEIGISHNDCHLDNFMCDDEYNFYLIDFGDAQPISVSDPKEDFQTLKVTLMWQQQHEGFSNLKYLVDHYQSLLDGNGI